MKKFILHIIVLCALAAVVIAQESTNTPPADPPSLPPTLTYTNGLNYRVAVSDHVYRQLRTVWRLSGATNQTFSQWATNHIRIELSESAAAYLKGETLSLGMRVAGMGAGPNDDVDLLRIKAAAQ